jgi:hypothetical protein
VFQTATFFIQGTWYESMRQKFKDSRRKEKENIQVKTMKEKYGSTQQKQKQAVDPMAFVELPRAKLRISSS